MSNKIYRTSPPCFTINLSAALLIIAVNEVVSLLQKSSNLMQPTITHCNKRHSPGVNVTSQRTFQTLVCGIRQNGVRHLCFRTTGFSLLRHRLL